MQLWAEMHIFYPHFYRESKKNIQKENGKSGRISEYTERKMQDKQDQNI